MNRILDTVAVTAVGALSRLPRSFALRLGRWFGATAHRLGGRKNPRIRNNLERAGVDDPVRTTGTAWRHMGQTMFEMFWMLDRSPDEALDGVQVHGMDQIRNAVTKGKGVLLVTAHAANWDLMSMALAREEIAPVAVIARNLRTPGLEKMQIECRERAGIRTLVRGEAGAGITAYRWLTKGGVLGVMMDRLSAGRRISVPFLGNATRMPLGPPELACRSGAAVVLGLSERTEGGGTVVRYRELETAGISSAVEMAKTIAIALDRELHTRPEQWFWIYRRQTAWNGEYTLTDK